jgi:hypothetical protein
MQAAIAELGLGTMAQETAADYYTAAQTDTIVLAAAQAGTNYVDDPWRESESLVSAPTVTVSRANARHLDLRQTNDVVLVMDAASYPATGFATIALSISNTAAWNLTAGGGINTSDWAKVENVGTNANHFLLHKPVWETEFMILQRNQP